MLNPAGTLFSFFNVKPATSPPRKASSSFACIFGLSSNNENKKQVRQNNELDDKEYIYMMGYEPMALNNK